MKINESLTELFFENVVFLQNVQLLLGVKYHNILLRIVFELILSLVENRPAVVEQFRNLFTIDILLKIFEDYQDDDLKLSALETISALCKSDTLMGSYEISLLIRKLFGPVKLLNNLGVHGENHEILVQILTCIQVVTADDQDVLIEFKELNAAQVLIELLQKNLKNSILVCHILSVLTNLSLNDQINVNIRILGAHVIGRILMDNCPALIKSES